VGSPKSFCLMWFLVSRLDLADWEPSGLNLGFLFWVLLWSLFLGCSFACRLIHRSL